MRCPHCGVENSPSRRFCYQCASPLTPDAQAWQGQPSQGQAQPFVQPSLDAGPTGGQAAGPMPPAPVLPRPEFAVQPRRPAAGQPNALLVAGLALLSLVVLFVALRSLFGGAQDTTISSNSPNPAQAPALTATLAPLAVAQPTPTAPAPTQPAVAGAQAVTPATEPTVAPTATATLPPIPPTPTPLSDIAVSPTALPPAPQAPPPPIAVLANGAAAPTRPGDRLSAARVGRRPSIDGDLREWPGDGQPVQYLVFGRENSSGPDDLSGRVWFGWDDQALYLATQVTDDVLSQVNWGSSLYEGDSVEVQWDVDLAGDFNSNEFDADDWHIGLSPGNFEDRAPEAFVWAPRALSGAAAGIQVAARPIADVAGTHGYTLEAAIPWRLVGVTPQAGFTSGLAFSISDDDAPTPAQQSMLSTSAARQWHRPPTFNTFSLEP